MRINSIDNRQSFGAVYKLRANAANLEQFETSVAPLYRSIKKNGIRACVRNVSEMYALTGKDAYEFDVKYAHLMRSKNDSKLNNPVLKKLADNVRYLASGQNNFMNSFLKDKNIEPLKDFNNLLERIF